MGEDKNKRSWLYTLALSDWVNLERITAHTWLSTSETQRQGPHKPTAPSARLEVKSEVLCLVPTYSNAEWAQLPSQREGKNLAARREEWFVFGQHKAWCSAWLWPLPPHLMRLMPEGGADLRRESGGSYTKSLANAMRNKWGEKG